MFMFMFTVHRNEHLNTSAQYQDIVSLLLLLLHRLNEPSHMAALI